MMKLVGVVAAAVAPTTTSEFHFTARLLHPEHTQTHTHRNRHTQFDKNLFGELKCRLSPNLDPPKKLPVVIAAHCTVEWFTHRLVWPAWMVQWFLCVDWTCLCCGLSGERHCAGPSGSLQPRLVLATLRCAARLELCRSIMLTNCYMKATVCPAARPLARALSLSFRSCSYLSKLLENKISTYRHRSTSICLFIPQYNSKDLSLNTLVHWDWHILYFQSQLIVWKCWNDLGCDHFKRKKKCSHQSH